MDTLRLAIGILLVGATQAAAQGKDTTSGNTPTATSSKSTNQAPAAQSGVSAMPSAPNGDDGAESVTPRCWLGCRGTLNVQRTVPAEWNVASRGRMDTLMALLVRKRKPVVPANVQQARLDDAKLRAATAAATGGPAAPVEAATSPATEADGQRFLVEEWRRSELGIADSIHHAVLARISRLYDSAQAPTVSADERLHVLQQVDGINAVNQLTWMERREDVNREADSAIRAIPPAPSP